jgi:putative transposase
MEIGLCLESLENAPAATVRVSKIFNTNKGCQYTSIEWTCRLLRYGVTISLDGRASLVNNFIISCFGGALNTRISTCSKFSGKRVTTRR